MYSSALGSRYFKWKMLSLPGSNILLCLQRLIALVSKSNVNVLPSPWVSIFSLLLLIKSLFRKCIYPVFVVLNCWLNLQASCLGYGKKVPLTVSDSFSAWCFALPLIPWTVLHRLFKSIYWYMVSAKSLDIFPFVCTYVFWYVIIQSW